MEPYLQKTSPSLLKNALMWMVPTSTVTLLRTKLMTQRSWKLLREHRCHQTTCTSRVLLTKLRHVKRRWPNCGMSSCPPMLQILTKTIKRLRNTHGSDSLDSSARKAMVPSARTLMRSRRIVPRRPILRVLWQKFPGSLQPIGTPVCTLHSKTMSSCAFPRPKC